MRKGASRRLKEPQRLSSADYVPHASLSMQVYRPVVGEPLGVHWHEFYEVHFILAGSGMHLLNGTTQRLLPGALFLLTPADFHALTPHPGQPLELFNVVFTEEVLSAELRQLLFASEDQLFALVEEECRTALEAEFRRLQTEAAEQRAGYQLIMRATLERLLVDLSRRCAQASHSSGRALASPHQQSLHQALTYIQHHFREPLSLDEVARQAGLSPHYFSECFHKTTGLTFQGYVQDLRLRFASALLGVSQVPVTTIAASAGFASLAHFERVFKRRFGQSPRAYQRQRGAAPQGERIDTLYRH
ncbi:MAG TPA: helix-turn-helix domain-containing protein [Ktedonobacterales bacterium]|nr:helix-turn-helix domain-containing protein [Ktedonobacterales bacterium]